MKTRYVLIGAIILFCTPILLNILVGVPNPVPNIDVIGTPVDWLSFYGSYIGAILTVLVGLLAIFCESKRNTLNIMIQEQTNHIDKLNLDLAELVSSFEFWYLGSISLNFGGKGVSHKEMFDRLMSIKDSYLSELNELYRKASHKGNNLGLIFSDNKNEKVKRFREKYLQCLNSYLDDINSLTKEISKVESVNDMQAFMDFLNSFNVKTDANSKCYQRPLFDAAQEWIRAEEHKLEIMKAEQEKLFPNLMSVCSII